MTALLLILLAAACYLAIRGHRLAIRRGHEVVALQYEIQITTRDLLRISDEIEEATERAMRR